MGCIINIGLYRRADTALGEKALALFLSFSLSSFLSFFLSFFRFFFSLLPFFLSFASQRFRSAVYCEIIHLVVLYISRMLGSWKMVGDGFW